jgi:two-component system phosphate regulon sensor histidine kinase PhoR
MLRSRFLWKLYAAYVALILLATIIVGTLIARQVERDSLEEVQASLKARAVLLKDVAGHSLEGLTELSVQERVRTLGSAIGTRFTVIRSDGVVVADSEKHPATMDNHTNRPEILAARSQGHGTATRFSNTLGTRMMYLALPVKKEGRLTGYVRASLPLSAIDARIGHLRRIVALGAGMAMLVALPVGFFFARRFTRPLTSMTTVAESMASGDYDQRLHVLGKDEIGQLAQALNRMAESSRDRMETIGTEHNKLRTILAGMEEGVVAVDRQERVVHMNAAAGRILRASPEGSLGKGIREATRVGEVCDTIARTLRDKADVKGDFRLAARPSDRVVGMHGSPLRDSEGELVGAVIVLHDLSELHRLETVRRDFVANVSHELKTPITAIRGLVETLIDDRDMTRGNLERFLAKIRDQSMRLSSVVTDLLALSRLESESAVPERKSVDLREVLVAAVQPLLSTGEGQGLAVETQIPEEPVKVTGDDEALRQATSNLLDNALKYTPKEGRVWIRLRSEGGHAVIEVQDTGIGIEPRDQARIFERFYRVDKARSRDLGGTGLGLSIVKHIALAHDGEVSVDSVPGRGSTFRMKIPITGYSA